MPDVFSLMYGMGATVGPILTSLAMMNSRPAGLFAFSAAMHFVLIVFVVVRYLRSRSVADTPIAFGDALSAAQTASQVFEEELEQDKESDA